MTGSPQPRAQRLQLLAWYAAGFAMLLVLPSQLWGNDVVWMLPRAMFLEALITPILYAGGAAVLFAAGWHSRPPIATRLTVVAVAVAAIFGVLLDQGVAATRDLLVFITALCAIFLLGPPVRKYLRTAATIVAVIGAATAVIFAVLTREDSIGRQVVLHTGYHTIEATYHPRLHRSITEGGGIAPLAGGYLVVPGDGSFYYLQWQGSRLQSRRLALRAPLERDLFRSDAPAAADARLFRVGDVLVKSGGDEVTVFVSHHAWYPEGRCFTLRVSYITTSVAALISDAVGDSWVTLFETQPCLPLKDRSFAFAGLQNGGRMALLDERTLLLTVGDHEFDGIYSDVALPQLADNDYGKTLLVSLDDGSRQIYTLGHRNPQGLRVDRNGNIWLTEHGPAGGDELNRLVRGGDYGWPLHTYGVDYEEGAQPVPEPGPESPIVMPERAWIPSIGISNLIDLRGTQFEHWAGNLLVGSLRAETLYRVHRRAGSIAYIERIPIGERIRDLIEDESGRILLWTDSGSVVSLRSMTLGSVELALRQCLACHTLDHQHGIGPGLAGIVGRPVAGSAGYAYSESLRSLGGYWTDHRLDEFLENPSQFAPGNKMAFSGIDDPQARAALIELLKRHGSW
jgi:aldose sugar dehydrogenase